MADYTVRQDGTAANLAAALNGNPATASQCLSLAGLTSYGSGAAAGDRFLFESTNGGTYRPLPGAAVTDENIWLPLGGTLGHSVEYRAYPGHSPVISGAHDLTSAAYKWTESPATAGEYYCELAAGGDPSLADPNQLFMDDVRLEKGTIGALADHEWEYGNNDTLGYNTVYIADASGDPDTTAVQIEGSVSQRCLGIANKSYITVDGIVFEKAREDCVTLATNTTAMTGIVFSNCEFNRAYWRGIAGGHTEGWEDCTATIEDCLVSYNALDGIHAARETVSWVIRRNECHHNASYKSSPGGYGTDNADIKTNFSGGHVIEKNYIHDSYHVGIWCDTGGSGIYIRWNRVATMPGTADPSSAGIGIRVEDGIVDSFVYGNVVTGCEDAGISVAGTGTVYTYIRRIKVYNNSCYGNVYGIVVSGTNATADSCVDIHVYNNALSGNTTRNLSCFNGGDNNPAEGSGNIYKYNFIKDGTGLIYWERAVDATKDSVAAWEADATTGTGVSNNSGLDTLFTSAATGDLSLQSISPCINYAYNLGSPYNLALNPSSSWPGAVSTLDQDLHGSGWDVGAYVYAQEGPTGSASGNKICRILHLIMGR